MMLLYMALGLTVQAARRQGGTLAFDEAVNQNDYHKEYDPRKLNRRENLNRELFDDNGNLKAPDDGYFYIKRWGTKYLHVKPVGRFKGDGVVYWALEQPTPLKWLAGGMIQVGGKFAPVTHNGTEKKKGKTRLCLQWRKGSDHSRHIATSPWGVEFQTGPCPAQEDRKDNYLYSCGDWMGKEVFGRSVDVHSRDWNKISQGYTDQNGAQ